MKSAIFTVLLASILVGSALFGLHIHRRSEKTASYRAALHALQLDFLRRSPALNQVEPERYPEEARALLAAYFRRLRRLGQEFPEQMDVERARGEVRAERAAGTLDAAQLEQRRERIDETLALFETLRAGSYAPFRTARDRGLRLDLLGIRPVERAGQQHLRLSFLRWGEPGEVLPRSIEGRFNVASAADDGPRAIPKLHARDQPPTLDIVPTRWVSEFIPGVRTGYYELPLLPADAQDLSLSFDFEVKTLGGSSIPVQLVFPGIPIADEWRAGEEEPWARQHRFVTEEELRAEGTAR